jgi:uncharacterized protein YqjF (DUF2071 family)
MLAFLKNHPFEVEAFFQSSLVLTFAAPKEQIQHLIPECLQLDTFNDKWAFIAVAMVQTQALRPKGFPKFMGNNFFLIGYRVFVHFTNQQGKRLRGLYIIKSETDKKKMEFFGNIFTHYNYATTDIDVLKQNDTLNVSSKSSGFNVTVEHGNEENIHLPQDSPFANWKEARRFAGPLPFTFTYNQHKSEVLIIEGVRTNWTPKPIKVINHHFNFIDDLKLNKTRLANAFIIQNVPYHWKKGKIEKWNKKEDHSRAY